MASRRSRSANMSHTRRPTSQVRSRASGRWTADLRVRAPARFVSGDPLPRSAAALILQADPTPRARRRSSLPHARRRDRLRHMPLTPDPKTASRRGGGRVVPAVLFERVGPVLHRSVTPASVPASSAPDMAAFTLRAPWLPPMTKHTAAWSATPSASRAAWRSVPSLGGDTGFPSSNTMVSGPGRRDVAASGNSR